MENETEYQMYERQMREMLAKKEDLRWISVDDRLPEIADEVLICAQDDPKRIIIIAHWDGESWMSDLWGYIDPPPTHWMPKPSLPSQG